MYMHNISIYTKHIYIHIDAYIYMDAYIYNYRLTIQTTGK
jgi:hypothetical protein